MTKPTPDLAIIKALTQDAIDRAAADDREDDHTTLVMLKIYLDLMTDMLAERKRGQT